MIIFFNFISATDGGQVTRVNAILERIDRLKCNKIIIVKDKNTTYEYKVNERLIMLDISIGAGNKRFLNRLYWENIEMPKLIKIHKADIYITFSNYLPLVNLNIPTISGISNLAPFSQFAIKEEKTYYKLKFFILKHLIYFPQKSPLLFWLYLTLRKQYLYLIVLILQKYI